MWRNRQTPIMKPLQSNQGNSRLHGLQADTERENLNDKMRRFIPFYNIILNYITKKRLCFNC